MKRKILLLFVLLFSISFAYAQEDNQCHEISSDILQLQDFEVPKGVPYNNERANIYTLDEEVIGHVIIEDKIVTSLGCNNITDPTYNVYVKDKQTIEDIKNSETPVDEFNAKLKTDDLVIEGTSFGKKFKGFFGKLGLKIAGWFT